MRKAFVALLLAASVLAGCSGGSDDKQDQLTPPVTGLYAGPALWADPQNTPHPGWNWPTLSNPPAAGTPGVPASWQPIPQLDLPEHITKFDHITGVEGIPVGAGIAVFGSLVFVPGEGSGSWVVDVHDPANPVVLSQIESAGRGAAFIAYPNGRLVVASATSPGFDLIDVTDPAHPELLPSVEPSQGGHKLGVVPGTPILYNAASAGGDPGVPGVVGHPLDGPGLCNVDISQCVGYTEIYDLTDPENPVLVQEFPNGLSCHHIFFWNAPDGSKQRAICAGIQYTQIWDTADPLHPKVLVSLPVHHGVPGTPSAMASIEAFSHSAGINIEGNILYVGDESGGGGAPPGCLASVGTPLGALSVPLGATWFYDISDELDPSLLGWYAPGIGAGTYVSGIPVLAPGDVGLTSLSCTTHHGRVIPDKEGRDLLAMSYYGDGVILLDFTGIDVAAGVLPTVVDTFAEGSNTWETWYASGYLFTGDLSRGMDVFKFG